MSSRYRNYWVYSIGVGVALAIILAIVAATKPDNIHTFVLIFAGWAMGGFRALSRGMSTRRP